MKYGIIYKATNTENGKVYVGQTINALTKRKSYHAFRAKKGDKRSAFQAALLEHGLENFSWGEIDQADSQEELDQKEKAWIAHFQSDKSEHGYNFQVGGKCGKFGKPMPEKWRENISIAQMGHSVSEEARRKMSEAARNMSPEKRQKISRAKRGIQAGENNPAAKLTEYNVVEIKIALANGETSRFLAKKYKVSKTIILEIKHGRAWSHVRENV